MVTAEAAAALVQKTVRHATMENAADVTAPENAQAVMAHINIKDNKRKGLLSYEYIDSSLFVKKIW